MEDSRKVGAELALQKRLSQTCEDLGRLARQLKHSNAEALEGALEVLAAAPWTCNASISREVSLEIGSLVRAAYPAERWARKALFVWRLVDRDSVARFLLEEIDLRTAARLAPDRVVADVAAIGPQARECLESLQSMGGRAGQEAKRVVDLLFPSPLTLSSLRERWLHDRSGKALADLYGAYVSTMRLGETTMEDILEAFGEPSRRDPVTIEYSTAGTSATFEQDERGKVIGAHLT